MMQRRDLLKASAAWTAVSYSRVFGAAERIRIAGLGVGGRATYLLGLAAKAENTEIVAVCDVSEPHRLAAKQKFAPGGKDYLDYREVLGRNDIDAVVIGAPDHWHVPMTIDAVKAGKDVYVEKPVSHTIEEGERVEKAVTNSKQIVQVGYQQRSWPHFLQAREMVAGGKLGPISLVLTSWYQDYVANLQTPPTLDAVEDRLEAISGLGARSALRRAALHALALVLGFRRRTFDRPVLALRRRGAVVPGAVRAAHGAGHRKPQCDAAIRVPRHD